jgi:hypothetical protein
LYYPNRQQTCSALSIVPLPLQKVGIGVVLTRAYHRYGTAIFRVAVRQGP